MMGDAREGLFAYEDAQSCYYGALLGRHLGC
jgi:hypothetical protein